jgi:hypothetical protein
LIRLLISPVHAVYGEEEYKHERQSASRIVGSAAAKRKAPRTASHPERRKTMRR